MSIEFIDIFYLLWLLIEFNLVNSVLPKQPGNWRLWALHFYLCDGNPYRFRFFRYYIEKSFYWFLMLCWSTDNHNCSMKQFMLFTWLLWKRKRISPLFLIIVLVNEPNTVLRDKEGGCYISILLKPHLYRARFLTERNVPCKEI